jgi:hypothetical protein
VHRRFEGWYYKQQAAECLALIPALHAENGVKTASLQIVTEAGGVTLPFPPEKLTIDRRGPFLRLGENRFGPKGLHLAVREDGMELAGDLRFTSPARLRYDIMGPFAFLPMECRHSVFSMRHGVSGALRMNGRLLNFDGGTGYAEGDRGRSFPKRYLWTQCSFEEGSLMLSVADIPFAGGCFTGMIGFVYRNGREKRIATYLGARPIRLGSGLAVVRQGAYTFSAEFISGRDTHLRAPQQGEMTRLIRESLCCRVRYRFCRGEDVLLDFVSDRASFENEYE